MKPGDKCGLCRHARSEHRDRLVETKLVRGACTRMRMLEETVMQTRAGKIRDRTYDALLGCPCEEFHEIPSP